MLRECCSSSTVETLVQDLPMLARPGDGLCGTWVAIHAIRNGRDTEYIRGLRLIVESNRFVVQGERGDMVYRGTIQVNVDAEPAQIDFTHERDMFEGTTWKGIYQTNGKTLRICTNSPNPRGSRPDEFTAPLGSDRVMILLRRD